MQTSYLHVHALMSCHDRYRFPEAWDANRPTIPVLTGSVLAPCFLFLSFFFALSSPLSSFSERPCPCHVAFNEDGHSVLWSVCVELIFLAPVSIGGGIFHSPAPEAQRACRSFPFLEAPASTPCYGVQYVETDPRTAGGQEANGK